MSDELATRGLGLRDRVWRFLEPDSTWERPLPAGATRRDLMLGALYLLLASAALELMRSVDQLTGLTIPIWAQHLITWGGVAPLAVRRRYAVACMVATMTAFVGMWVWTPMLALQFSIQLAWAVGLYSGIAWAKDRRAMTFGLLAVTVMFFGLLAYSFALGSATSDFLAHRDGTGKTGVLSPILAFVGYTVAVNVVYIGGAVLTGQTAWRNAYRQTLLRTQNEQLTEQAETISQQARVNERLRIARELHDVVAHHVSVIGIQAAAARKVLTRQPDMASQALTVVEESSRQAVTEMRNLLGTLRSDTVERPATEGVVDRNPDPRADDIEAMVAAAIGVDVSYEAVEDRPGAISTIPPGVGLALFRTVQEALANIRRHSTATAAQVTVRVGTDSSRGRYAEVEILDDGLPRTGTSGTGLGLLGVRERLASLSGVSEIGPRPTGGYRVRVRFPIPAPGAHLRAV